METSSNGSAERDAGASVDSRLIPTSQTRKRLGCYKESPCHQKDQARNDNAEQKDLNRQPQRVMRLPPPYELYSGGLALPAYVLRVSVFVTFLARNDGATG